MGLSAQRITALRSLLKEEFGLDYSDQQAQQAGIAIMRFVVAKHRRTSALPINDYHEENKPTETRPATMLPNGSDDEKESPLRS